MKEATIAKVEAEINQLLNSAKQKAIMDKQAHYIIHNVLYPIIEYRTQAVYVAKTRAEKWDRKIRNLLRKKSKLLRDMPIASLSHPHFLNLKSIHDFQCESKITSLLVRLNSTDKILQIAIQQILECQLAM